MKNSDIPAFPQDVAGRRSDDPTTQGMTVREWFAGLAMQGLLSSGPHDCDEHGIAHDALLHADALLAELEATE